MTLKDHPPVNEFLDHISLDCVIFGFHDNELKVLMLKLKNSDFYSLPGGFLGLNESLEEAAGRVLKERTGLDQIFLEQFRVFSEPLRSLDNPAVELLKEKGISKETLDFLNRRFITIGFYALVDFTRVNPMPDSLSEKCEWLKIQEISSTILDHKSIIGHALKVLRLQLSHQPVGYNLLPLKFTMPELQKLYETILDKKLDRRNFQRKVLSYNILKRLPERRRGGAHKSPFLYEFQLENYPHSLQEGLKADW